MNFLKITFQVGLLVAWHLSALASGVAPDSLPAGTKIQLKIQVPGDATANNITYTIPAPVLVVIPPVAIRPTGVLYDGQIVGKRGDHVLIVRGVNEKLFLTEDFGTGFLFRGKNLLSRTDVQTDYAKLAPQLSGGETLFGGLTEPVGVAAPVGYVQKRFSDGAVYYGKGDNSPPVVDPPKEDKTPTGGGAAFRLSNQTLSTYTLEGAGQFRPAQFAGPPGGTSKYYSPNFGFSVDFQSERSLDERRAVGENRFQIGSLDEAQKQAVRPGEGILYYTESSSHGPLEGSLYYEYSLQEFYNVLYDRVIYAGRPGPDQGVGLVAYNTETSNYWQPWSYTGKRHWPAWEASKNKRIQCEIDGQWRTLEELKNSGLWDAEENRRRGNRLALEFAMVAERAAPGVQLSYGASMWQGQSDYSRIATAQPFLESFPNVSQIGGNEQGEITLNRPGGGTATYKLTGTQYQNEDVMMGYYYRFTYDISGDNFRRIWQNPAGKTYADLWAIIKPINIVADEKAYLQANQALMVRRYGKTHPILRLWEPVYEDNLATLVDGVQLEAAARVPFPELRTDAVRAIGYGDIPKIWQPPYMSYGRYAVTRFRAGDEPGWGAHIFPAGPPRGGDAWYNQLLHPYSATYQARSDFQELEGWYASSTLVEDPEVKTNSTGEWMVLDGPRAYGYHDGVQDAPKVAAMLRYKPNDDNTTTVYVLAGMGQEYTESSTHLARVPNGLNGNIFQIQLCGPSAQLYRFTMQNTDAGKTYLGTCVNPPAGYSGRVDLN